MRVPYMILAAAAVTPCIFAATVSAQTVASTDFTGGTDGWQGNGGAQVQSSGGNDFFRIPGVTSMFWFEYWNDSNPDWIGDYSAKGDLLEFSVDIQTNGITVNGNPVSSRSIMLELRDYDIADDFYGYGSVYIELGTVSGFAQDWTTFSTVFDPNSVELPENWGAYGDEDDQGNYILPEGSTFASVLTGIDEILVHSAVPGQIYPFTTFDLMIDNITLTAIPAPGTLALLGVPALLAGRRRR